MYTWVSPVRHPVPTVYTLTLTLTLTLTSCPQYTTIPVTWDVFLEKVTRLRVAGACTHGYTWVNRTGLHGALGRTRGMDSMMMNMYTWVRVSVTHGLVVG